MLQDFLVTRGPDLNLNFYYRKQKNSSGNGLIRLKSEAHVMYLLRDRNRQRLVEIYVGKMG